MVIRLPLLLIVLGIGVVASALHIGQMYLGDLKLDHNSSNYGVSDDEGSRIYPRSATDADGYALRIARPSHRVASQYWSIDEFVYAVLPPEDVVSVSTYAYDHKYSNVFLLVEEFHPAITSDPEIVLKINPDLLLVSSTGRADFTDLLRKAGTPVFRMFTNFTTLEQVDRGIVLIGQLTGQDDAAQRVHRQFQKAIARARAAKPSGASSPRILGYSGRYSYGDQTFFDDIIRTVGGINVAAENGLHSYDPVSTEKILRWNPEWIVAGAANGDSKEVLRSLLQDPAIALTTAGQKGHVLVLDNKVFLPMSPFAAQLLDVLGEVLYANGQ